MGEGGGGDIVLLIHPTQRPINFMHPGGHVL